MELRDNWSRLDNAAKIFPPTSTENDTWVFRVSCQLKDRVDPETLQLALDKTIRLYPFYTSVIRKGLFWYYFEQSDLKPLVQEESKRPCGPLYDPGQKNLLFEVTYFRKRINFEVFHALTDGTGAMQFLRTLVYHYLLEAHPELSEKDIILKDSGATLDEKNEDGFAKYYTKEKREKPAKQAPAYQLSGACFPNHNLGVIEGIVSAKELIAIAKEQGATVTEFVTTLLFLSIHDGMNARSLAKPVVIVIPVNLRNFFPSESTKNFFSVANISHTFATQGDTFEDVLGNVKSSFAELITEEEMRNRLNALYANEAHPLARSAPLPIKDAGLKAAEWLSSKKNTASFSNIGKISMPTGMTPYIDYFDFFTSTKHLQVCLCSFGDSMCISFTTRYQSAAVQCGFFRRLSRLGVDINISANTIEQDPVR